jgi:hypothetical protein
MVLKSAFLLAVSASLVLTAQTALIMKDTPLYKRNPAEKEITMAVPDRKVVDCVEKSGDLGTDTASQKYVDQVPACKSIDNVQNVLQGMFSVHCESEVPKRITPYTAFNYILTFALIYFLNSQIKLQL